MAEYEDETTYPKEVNLDTPPGTKVICVSGREYYKFLVTGKIYTIRKVYFDNNWNEVRVKLVEDTKNLYSFYSWRFEIVGE